MDKYFPIRRTFSSLNSASSTDEQFVDSYHEFPIRSEAMGWSDVLQKRFVVILGEAGLGKTSEFRNQAAELSRAGKPAFFLALNRLSTVEGLTVEVADSSPRLQRWRESNETGYFFLDSVDESRLTGPTMLSRALKLVASQLLGSNGSRSSIYISSRISDWALPSIRAAVEEALFALLQGNVPQSEDLTNAMMMGGDSNLIVHQAEGIKVGLSLEVVMLDALDQPSAKALASFYRVSQPDRFWEEVIDGGYAFMATRPLDLSWMVRRWNKERQLGTYTQLLEHAISERLQERNSGRLEAGVVLSPRQLRSGAEALAAAAVFANRANIALVGATEESATIEPSDVLVGWKPGEIVELLGTALFDEASMSQVRFHHRVVREYLAASWINERLNDGLPTHKAIPLFVQSVYGTPVLIDVRRATLCWLAGMHAVVRQYVIQNFPEMVMFEGDPGRWSEDDVVEAFDALLLKLAGEYRPNWYNDSSEIRRLAKKLPPAILCDRLLKYANAPRAFYSILPMIKFARVQECAPVLRELYYAAAESDESLPSYIEVIGIIGNDDDRRAIAADLSSGRFRDAQASVAAIAACGVANVPKEVIQNSLRSMSGASDGASMTAFYINRSLLEGVTWGDMLKLLEVLLSILPSEIVKRLQQHGEVTGGLAASEWMLYAAPEWLDRAVALMPEAGSDVPADVVKLALLVRELRHSNYLADSDLVRIQSHIADRAVLRREIALEVMKANPKQIFANLVFGPGLVTFGLHDLALLLAETMRSDITAEEQALWFQLALDVTVLTTRSKVRRSALAQLRRSSSEAADLVSAEVNGRIRGVCQRRQRRHEQYRKKIEDRQRREGWRAELAENLASIRDGTDYARLTWLLRFALSEARSTKYYHPDIRVIRVAFGDSVADAFLEGLRRSWRVVEVKSPRVLPDHETPWAGILGLAGANADLAGQGLTSKVLSADDIERLAKLSVWTREHDPWFLTVVDMYPDAVFAAIRTWLEDELRDSTAQRQRVTEFSLSAPQPLKSRALALAMDCISENFVSDEMLRSRLFRSMRGQDRALRDRAVSYIGVQLGVCASAKDDGALYRWLEILATVDVAATVDWIFDNLPSSEAERGVFVASVASVLERSFDRDSNESDLEVAALTKLFQLFADNGGIDAPNNDDGITKPSSTVIGVSMVLQRLVTIRGSAAHNALRGLVDRYASSSRRGWIAQNLYAHAAREVEATSAHAPAELAVLEKIFCRDPETATELYAQVTARLVDIRDGVENGPFSERLLLRAGTPEKHLQLWLASRLSDTPFRRFNPRFQVHREPEVDDDKRTDIELSARAGKICIEVKPLDRKRSYSASSLADTIRTQLVGQYLRGRNSRHGILVLMLLQNKKWDIPGRARRQPFTVLLEYLREECATVLGESPDIEALDIVGIDCVAPAK